MLVGLGVMALAPRPALGEVPGAAAPPGASPLRVAIECERAGRTKACPLFLRGFLDAHRVLLASPRAAAEIVLYVTATEVAQVDRLQLRFVSSLAGTPPIVEVTAELDTRAGDDAQRAGLEAAFLRGLVLYVGSRFPESVQLELGAPAAVSGAVATSPWDVGLEVSGEVDRTAQYRSYAGSVILTGARLERRRRLALELSASGGLERQPPLVLDDGTTASLDSEEWTLESRLEGAWLLDDRWAVGGVASGQRGDARGQLRHAGEARLAVEWDAFPADDPRGNRLAVLYALGYRAERYNLRNELGERFARYAVHQLGAGGSLRRDGMQLGLTASVSAELMRPGRRYHVSVSPFVEWKLGDHVDLSLSFSVEQRELPGPDPSQLDPSDYAQQSRLSYAEPLAVTGAVSLLFHLDRTNGQRNDRLTDL